MECKTKIFRTLNYLFALAFSPKIHFKLQGYEKLSDLLVKILNL